MASRETFQIETPVREDLSARVDEVKAALRDGRQLEDKGRLLGEWMALAAKGHTFQGRDLTSARVTLAAFTRGVVEIRQVSVSTRHAASGTEVVVETTTSWVNPRQVEMVTEAQVGVPVALGERAFKLRTSSGLEVEFFGEDAANRIQEVW